MRPSEEEELGSSNQAPSIPETGPFVLRTLLDDVPLSADGDERDVRITCVEFLGRYVRRVYSSSTTKFNTDQNLYVGTSSSELLHFVQIPPDPEDEAGQPSYILASRLLPAYHEPSSSTKPGIQQILLLPQVNKACILCNFTVAFYALPELSPVFGTQQIRPCNWIGGIDLNTDVTARSRQDGFFVTVLVSLNKKMRVIKIGEEDARPHKVFLVSLYCKSHPLLTHVDNRFRRKHNLCETGVFCLCREHALVCSP